MITIHTEACCSQLEKVVERPFQYSFMIMVAIDQFWKFLKTVRKKSFTELILCLFLLVLIPAYYLVDVFHILPCMYRLPSGTIWYVTHVLPLTFMVFNLLTNFVAVMYADSSVIGRLLTVTEYTPKGIQYYCTKKVNNNIQFNFFQKILCTVLFANAMFL